MESKMWSKVFLAGTLFLSTSLAFQKDSGKAVPHVDYVPDKETAERIAETLLVSAYGRERVDAQKPLITELKGKTSWLVQGAGTLRSTESTGGNFGVWINKHSGCVTVMEHMK